MHNSYFKVLSYITLSKNTDGIYTKIFRITVEQIVLDKKDYRNIYSYGLSYTPHQKVSEKLLF